MDINDWISNAGECFHINLVRPSSTPGPAERILDQPIHPTYTYSLFGDDEVILGYEKPSITLDFRANDLRPYLDFKFKRKVDLSSLLGDAAEKQVDVEAVLREHLPESAFEPDGPDSTIGPDATSKAWKPPGKLLNSFERRGRQYEIWSASLADPAALQLWRNMQILVLLFIDGASPLELDEDWTFERWTLHLLYEVTPLQDSSVSPYTIAGFSTSHRYWIFPTLEVLRATKSLPSPPASTNGNASPYKPPRLELAGEEEPRIFKEQPDLLQAPSRERISQFLILPHRQRQSLGARLYETIFGHYVKMANIYEIPVEDPNEDFDAMRDYCDIAYLRGLPAFNNLSPASSLPPESLKKDAPIPRDEILGSGTDLTALRHEAKIVPRQFNRMVELHLLSQIPPLHRNRARITRKDKSSNEDDRKYYFWRLALKERIYRQNADVLDQLKDDPGERNKQLEFAVDNQQDEYVTRLNAIERREKRSSAESDSTVEPTSGGRSPYRGYTRRKRARVALEEDDEDLEDTEAESVGSKKAKV